MRGDEGSQGYKGWKHKGRGVAGKGREKGQEGRGLPQICQASAAACLLSDLHGLPKATNPLVDESIKKASKDTPEVTQVGMSLGGWRAGQCTLIAMSPKGFGTWKVRFACAAQVSV